jgi:BirA family transcriptional regulator, biotin operon repressor / biotin---[acetyl-CoA-carboxylase] ligase
LLNPDIIIKKLKSNISISRVFYFDEIDSTNNFAKKNNVAPGSLIITNFQTKGRARFERIWNSEKDLNLTFTLTKKLNNNNDQIYLIYAVSYAICITLKKLFEKDDISSKAKVSIKWPNDIIINEKKVAGILIESKPMKNIYIIGIGINVNQKKFSPEIKNIATSINKISGKIWDLNFLLVLLVKNLEKYIGYTEKGKLRNIYTLWKKSLNVINKKVNFLNPKGVLIKGIVTDILENGNIQIDQNGKIHEFSSGELKLRLL